jgi:hypothetical protein
MSTAPPPGGGPPSSDPDDAPHPTTPPEPRTTVSGQDLIRSVEQRARRAQPALEKTTDVQLLSPTQQAGLWLAGALGIAMAVITAWALARALSPPVPALVADDAIAKAQIANYTHLSNAARDGALKIFDAVVVKSLLPIFTTIVGYIFGLRAGKASD